jgi:hypothetical protein
MEMKDTRKTWFAWTLVAAAGLLAGCDDDDGPTPSTDGSPPDGQVQSDGGIPDAGGAKNFVVKVENVAMEKGFFASGAFDTPVGETAAGVVGPGQAYEFTFDAPVGSKLSLATMFVQSNDLFYAPSAGGIALYDNDGMPLSGNVTDQLKLWDAGSEVNQEPGLGADQAPRQSGPNSGAADTTANVHLAMDAFGNLPAVDAVIQLTLTTMAEGRFKARIENVSTATTLQTSENNSTAVPLSPGVWVVHTADAPLFESGAADRDEGLEALAEDGDPSTLATALAAQTGVTQLLAPGVWAVHSADAPLFQSGGADRGEGLEALAEDGDPSTLATALSGRTGVRASGTFTTPDGTSSPAPAGPGASYSFSVSAMPGDRLSLATMMVQTNDLFYAPDEMGIALFDGNGMPASGDLTAGLMLWDAGTETNQQPGLGSDQAPRQGGANAGTTEGGQVRPVDDAFDYPETSAVIRLTLTPQ